jgi:plasmid stabilization system protein ParE
MTQPYKLSRSAAAAIEDIVVYTDETFGPNQTAAYIAGLEASFDLLTKFPGPALPHSRSRRRGGATATNHIMF